MRVKYIITSLILGSFLTGDTGNDACVLRGYRFDRLLVFLIIFGNIFNVFAPI